MTTPLDTVMQIETKCLKSYSQRNLRKGETVLAQRDNLLAIGWHDVRDVHILTISYEDMFTEMSQREIHQKRKSLAIVNYNKNKIAVDKSDQLMAY